MNNLIKVARTVSPLWIGSIIGSGSTFVIYIILARVLGVENFGIFGSALSTASIFTLIAGMGISQFWLKIFGKEGWNGIRWVLPSIKLLILSFLMVIILLFIWAYFGPHSNLYKNILILIPFFILGQISVQLVHAKLQLEERYSFLAIWQFSPNLSRLIIIITAIYISHYNIKVISVMYIYGIIGFIFFLLSIYDLFSMHNDNFRLKGHEIKEKTIQHDFPSMYIVMKESLPFGIASVFAFIYVQSDIIMVKYLAGDSEAGYYNAAFSILTAIMIFPTVLYQKYFIPKFHRWAHYEKEKFFIAYKKGNLIMALIGIFIMVLLLYISGWLIQALFGKEYYPTITLLKIIALAIPFYFISYSLGSTLVTMDNIKLKIKFMGFVAIINIILNIILIPQFLAQGAAIATLISNVCLFILYYIGSQKWVFKKNKLALE